jgi:hypothetical protein
MNNNKGNVPMKKNIFAVTALAALMASGAWAQTTTTDSQPGPDTDTANTSADMMGWSTWDADQRAVFFDDTMTLRSEADVTTSWATLSAEQQAAIRASCEAGSAQDAGGGATGGAGGSTGTAQAGTTTSGPGGSGTSTGEASGSAAGGATAPMPDAASFTQVCDWVETF